MDADRTLGGDQAFVLGGRATGQIRVVKMNGASVVQGNTDSDRHFEFELIATARSLPPRSLTAEGWRRGSRTDAAAARIAPRTVNSKREKEGVLAIAARFFAEVLAEDAHLRDPTTVLRDANLQSSARTAPERVTGSLGVRFGGKGGPLQKRPFSEAAMESGSAALLQ